MATPDFFVATWGDGVFRVNASRVDHELAGHPVRGLVAHADGTMLAIVDDHALYRRSREGVWAELVTSDVALACCLPLDNVVFVGTQDARLLRIDPDDMYEALAGFDAVEGRDSWYAGGTVVDGRMMGPPLGVRSMAATCDGAVLLVNVHVGGIPRSTDRGTTWSPTIDVESDVHEVRAHASRPEIAVAAAATGLCVSRDGGATWTTERRGLYEPYCSAVALGRNAIYVSASDGPFAADGAVYRRPIDGDDAPQPIGGGFPARTDGRVDTECIATRGATVAVVESSGRLFASYDDGASWSSPIASIPDPSGVCIG
jgi:photosystem II stability/assembly factor-like uncharacterized protein